MGIRLPNWGELSKDEQIPILNLPTDKNYVVVGPPGSGKTVLALHRAARLKKEGRGVLILTYNRLLSIYLQEALEKIGLADYAAQTYHTWLSCLFSEKLRCSLPTGKNNFDYKWEAIHSRTKDLQPVIDHLIIDETQDFPVELLKLLARLSKNATIFADPQQAIFENTQTNDLTAIFKTPNPYMLTRNYRNTVEIANASRLFASGDAVSIPSGAFRPGKKPRVIQCTGFPHINKVILNYARDNRSETIGVIVDYNAVNATVKGLENDEEIPVDYYKSKSKMDTDITSPGIKVMSFGVMKGLEFDTVFISSTDRVFKKSEDEQKDMRRMYVALSRASDSLLFTHQGHKPSQFYPDVLGVLRGNKEMFDWGLAK